mgnify:CR=1 FL=1
MIVWNRCAVKIRLPFPDHDEYVVATEVGRGRVDRGHTSPNVKAVNVKVGDSCFRRRGTVTTGLRLEVVDDVRGVPATALEPQERAERRQSLGVIVEVAVDGSIDSHQNRPVVVPRDQSTATRKAYR